MKPKKAAKRAVFRFLDPDPNRIQEQVNWPKLTNKSYFEPYGLCTYVGMCQYFSWKIQLFVTASLTRIRNRILMDPHWFVSLDPHPNLDPHWWLRIRIRIDIMRNRNTLKNRESFKKRSPVKSASYAPSVTSTSLLGSMVWSMERSLVYSLEMACTRRGCP